MPLKISLQSLSSHPFRRACFLALLVSSNIVYAADANHVANIHIRTLAASCAACHGTNGNSHSITPVLAGLDADYFTNQMLAFKNGDRSGTVMHHHAKGLTDDEITRLSHYFARQKRVYTPAPVAQKLKAAHE